MLDRVHLVASSLIRAKLSPNSASRSDHPASHRSDWSPSQSVRHHHQPSSKRFIRRAETDPYGKIKSLARGEPIYTARSAHKLIQLDQHFNLFPRHPTSSSPFRVLDLGAAPGGWTEVVIDRLAKLQSNPRGRASPHHLIACDLLDLNRSILSKVPKNTRFDSIKGDLKSDQVQAQISDLLKAHSHRALDLSPTTVILSDMLGPISGVAIRDAQESFEISVTVSDLAIKLTQPNGPPSDTLVLKHLQSELTPEFRARLLADWKIVKWFKPLASRAESREGYFVARKRKSSVD